MALRALELLHPLSLGMLVLPLFTAPSLLGCTDDAGSESTETGETGDGDGDPTGDGDGDGDPTGDGDGDGDPTGDGDGDGDPTGDGDGDLSAEFVEPPELVSAGGSLVGQLEVRFADNTLIINDPDTGEISSVEIYTRTYAGSIPGPTLRLQQGDLVDLELLNNLPENADADTPIADHNWPHHINSTNFHLHGFHVEPTGDADNSLREIVPQTSAAITLDVPANHNPGSHWYHGHKHGSLAVQFYSGMSGMIVVEGDIDEVPEIAAAEEQIMIIQELGLDDAGEVPDPNLDAVGPADLFAITQTYYPINGIVNPIIRMQPGEVQRWRLLNSTLASIMDLEIDAHELHQIAADGVTYAAVDSVPTLQMAPGDRADVLIQAGDPGSYQLTTPIGGPAMEEVVLATIIVEGDAVDMALPDDLPEPDYILPDASGETPDDLRAISFEAGAGPGEFTISGQAFDPACVNHILQLGDVVDWEITNNAGMGAHPFHIHTNAFQVLEVNGVTQSPARWHDVFLVPGNGGSVKVRMRVDDFVGGLVLHCHIVTHEELGMMHNVVIVDDNIPEQDKVFAADVDLSDPAEQNPDIPGYYISENFELCQ